MINKKACLEAVELLKGLSVNDIKNYKKMCNDGISVAQLFRDEIPTKGNCTAIDVNHYIKEEEDQMKEHLGVDKYNMSEISVAEHVYNEQNLEPEHAHSLYSPVPGDVKFFEEWLEGHHPSLGCLYNLKDQVPPDSYYEQLGNGREDARKYREEEDVVDYRGISGAGIYRRA